MLSEHANIPATGSGEEETCTCNEIKKEKYYLAKKKLK